MALNVKANFYFFYFGTNKVKPHCIKRRHQADTNTTWPKPGGIGLEAQVLGNQSQLTNSLL
jgi:hypothetical protein